jgi:hypothetical protein
MAARNGFPAPLVSLQARGAADPSGGHQGLGALVSGSLVLAAASVSAGSPELEVLIGAPGGPLERIRVARVDVLHADGVPEHATTAALHLAHPSAYGAAVEPFDLREAVAEIGAGSDEEFWAPLERRGVVAGGYRDTAAAWLENVSELERRMHETVQREVRFAGIDQVAGFWCWLTPWCLPSEPPFPR